MPTPAITLEVLPVGYGDCLLLSCPVGRRTWRMLLDTGPDETYPALRARLAKLPADSGGRSRQTQAEPVAAAAAARPVRSEQGPVRIATKASRSRGSRSVMVPRTDLPADLARG